MRHCTVTRKCLLFIGCISNQGFINTKTFIDSFDNKKIHFYGRLLSKKKDWPCVAQHLLNVGLSCRQTADGVSDTFPGFLNENGQLEVRNVNMHVCGLKV